MTLQLPKDVRAEAVASIERWFREERDERIGNLAAGALLDFFLREIAPSVYNRAVADVQERLLQRVQEVDLEVHEEEFAHWKPATPAGRRGPR